MAWIHSTEGIGGRCNTFGWKLKKTLVENARKFWKSAPKQILILTLSLSNFTAPIARILLKGSVCLSWKLLKRLSCTIIDVVVPFHIKFQHLQKQAYSTVPFCNFWPLLFGINLVTEWMDPIGTQCKTWPMSRHNFRLLWPNLVKRVDRANMRYI